MKDEKLKHIIQAHQDQKEVPEPLNGPEVQKNLIFKQLKQNQAVKTPSFFQSIQTPALILASLLFFAIGITQFNQANKSGTTHLTESEFFQMQSYMEIENNDLMEDEKDMQPFNDFLLILEQV